MSFFGIFRSNDGSKDIESYNSKVCMKSESSLNQEDEFTNVDMMPDGTVRTENVNVSNVSKNVEVENARWVCVPLRIVESEENLICIPREAVKVKDDLICVSPEAVAIVDVPSDVNAEKENLHQSQSEVVKTMDNDSIPILANPAKSDDFLIPVQPRAFRIWNLDLKALNILSSWRPDLSRMTYPIDLKKLYAEKLKAWEQQHTKKIHNEEEGLSDRLTRRFQIGWRMAEGKLEKFLKKKDSSEPKDD